MPPGRTRSDRYICNLRSRLREKGTKFLVDYMRLVQTQKQEILRAIFLIFNQGNCQ